MNSAIDWSDDTSSHSLKPLYETVHPLIHEEWHTHERLTTDDGGIVRFPGYFGNYAVRHNRAAGVPIGSTFRVERAPTMPITVRITG